MNFELGKSIEILKRTPKIYSSLFYDSLYDWDKIDEGTETWSGYNIIGHLIHGEKTDWIPRAEIILNDRENKTFEPYDRFAQDTLYSSQSTNELLNEFRGLRAQNIEKLLSWNLTEHDLQKEGIHPELGKVTLKQLIATWAVHDLGHLNQVSRVMVKHYAEDVGPWAKYNKLLQ